MYRRQRQPHTRTKFYTFTLIALTIVLLLVVSSTFAQESTPEPTSDAESTAEVSDITPTSLPTELPTTAPPTTIPTAANPTATATQTDAPEDPPEATGEVVPTAVAPEVTEEPATLEATDEPTVTATITLPTAEATFEATEESTGEPTPEATESPTPEEFSNSLDLIQLLMAETSCQMDITDAGDTNPFTFRFQALNVNNIASLDWDFGDTTSTTDVATGVGPHSYTYTDTGDFTISLTCTPQAGFGSPLSLTGKISITSVPVADFSLTPSTTFTDAPPIQVSTVNSSTGGGLTYAWKISNSSNPADVGDLHQQQQRHQLYVYICRDH